MRFDDKYFVQALTVITFILFVMLLTGCSTTVPVTQKFPEPPKYGLEPCPRLLKLTQDAKLSDVAANIIYNYSTYYECDLKNDTWINWYRTQKRIYEDVK